MSEEETALQRLQSWKQLKKDSQENIILENETSNVKTDQDKLKQRLSELEQLVDDIINQMRKNKDY